MLFRSSYCTLENIKQRVPEQVIFDLTQDDRNNSEINTTRVNAAIYDSDAIIDNKLRTRYSLPLAVIPNELIRVAVDITVYFIYRARYDNTMPDAVKEAYNNAMTYLNALQSGEESIISERISGNDFTILTNQRARDRWYSKHVLRKI